jgi:hypothetical protein
VQFRKALSPMLVTAFPSMISGITNAPDAAVSQSVMITVAPVASQVRSLRSAARSGNALASKQ